MTTHDDLFSARLASALTVEDRRDWLDVQRRAQRGRRRWITRPTGLLAAALVVAGGGSLALGLGDKLLDRDVPRPVKSELDHISHPIAVVPRDGAPPWLSRLDTGDKLVKGSSHLVLRVPTARGPISLYAARTTRGSVCAVTHGRGAGAGLCTATGQGSPPAPIDYAVEATGWKSRYGETMLVTGHARPADAVAVSVRFRGGSAKRITLTEGWFLYDVPRDHRRLGRHPIVAIDVLAVDGHRLATLRDPLRVNVPRGLEPTRPVRSTIGVVAAQRLPNGGGIVSLRDGRDALGRRCLGQPTYADGHWRTAWLCVPDVGRWGHEPGKVLERVPVQWGLAAYHGAAHDADHGFVFAYGWVAPAVESLRVRFQDGAQTEIPLVRRDFLFVVPKARWTNGHRPSIVLAYDRRGREVYRQFLYPRQHCVYPGRDPLCKTVLP